MTELSDWTTKVLFVSTKHITPGDMVALFAHPHAATELDVLVSDSDRGFLIWLTEEPDFYKQDIVSAFHEEKMSHGFIYALRQAVKQGCGMVFFRFTDEPTPGFPVVSDGKMVS